MITERNSSRATRTTRSLFIWALVVVAAMASGIGGAERPAEAAGAVVSEAPASTATEAVGAGGKIQSITFKKDMTIQDALQFLAARYQKNIVPSSKISGAITVTNLYDVTFEQALDAILGSGFKYEEKGNFINVYTADEFKKIREDEGRMVYRIFTLYYISAAEAKKLVTPVLSNKVRIEVTTAAVTTFPTGESISTVAGGGDTTAMNDTIIIFDYPENIEEAAKVLSAVDIRPKQVLIEATIMSVALTEGMQFGIDWQTLKGTAVSALTGIDSGAPDYFKSAGTGAKVGTSALTGGLTVGFALDDVGSFIRAVEEISDVTVLANPKILAINKQLGQVYIGKKIAYLSQTTQTQTSTTQQVNFLDTGTKLSFRPYIGNDGYIRMDIHPKDSDATIRGDLPDETSAELVTNIMVKDGQTIVIGGLFRDTVSIVRNQVPVLGDIPIVGLLFRGKADQIKREEVVVLLTPHIVEEPSETDGIARAEDIRRKRYGAQDELQTISRGRMAEEFYAKAARLHVEGDNESAMMELQKALRLRPAYLEAIRLKERILAQTDPDEAKKLERIILEGIDKQEAPKWLRR
jgi:type IV pilus assembly protein PilQ